MQDWGVTYDDLEPHYWRAEQMMGVSGKAGNLRGTIVEGGNPFRRPAPRTNTRCRRSRIPTRPPVRGRREETGLSSFSDARRQPEPGLQKSRRRLPRRLRLLRLLLALRLHGRRQGPAQQYADARAPRPQKIRVAHRSWVRRIVHKDGQAPPACSIPMPMAKSFSSPPTSWCSRPSR